MQTMRWHITILGKYIPSFKAIIRKDWSISDRLFGLTTGHYTVFSNTLGLLIKAGEIQEAINIFRPVFEQISQ